MSIFGRILDDSDIENAIEAVLKRWLPTYLAEVERQHDLTPPFYKRPSSWGIHSEMYKWEEDALPHILIIATGNNDQPVKDGRGQHRARWYIGVAAVVSASGETGTLAKQNTRLMANRYAAAIRAILVQKQSLDGALDGTVRGIDWVDGRANDMNPGDERTIWASRQVFTIEVDDVVSKNHGPVEPDPPDDPDAPLPDYPVVPDVDHVQNTWEKLPTDEEA